MSSRRVSLAVLLFVTLASTPSAAQFARPCPKKDHVRVKGKCISKAVLEARRRKAEAQRREAAARHRASLGSVTIKSLPPGARVWLDGKKQKGKTPLELRDIKIGDYVLELRKGFKIYKGKLTVESQKSLTRLYELKTTRGTLVVQSDPGGATIFLDGRKVGKTTTNVPNVESGEHVLELQLPGHAPTRQKVVLEVDRPRKAVTVKLQRKGVVKVSSDPPGAQVLVDGKKVGKTPGRLLMLPGARALQLRLAGHVTVNRSVKVELGKVLELSVKLKLTPAEKHRRAALERQRLKLAQMKRQDAERRRQEAKQRREKALADYERALKEDGPRRRSKSIWAYTTLGVGLALAAAGGVLVGVGYGQGESAQESYNAVDGFDQDAYDKYRAEAQSAQTQVIVGAAMAGAGLAVLGVSIYMFATRPAVPEKPVFKDNVSSVSVIPTRGGAAFSLSTTF